MTGRKNRVLGSALLLITAIVWGLAFVAQRNASGDLSAFAVNTFRGVLASAVLLVFFAVDSVYAKKKGLKRVGWNKETILGGILLGVILFLGENLQQMGVAETTAGKTGFITALYIVFVPLFSMLGRKKAGANCWYAVLIAIVGFYFISLSGENFTISRGDLMVLLCSFIYTFHIIYTEIFVRGNDPIKVTLISMVVSGIISIIAMAVAGEIPSPEVVSANIVPLLYIGLVSSGIGFTFQSLGQERVDSSLATLFMSLESVFGLIFGMIILKEPIATKELCGCLLVFIGIFIAQFEFPHTFLKLNKSRYFVE